MMQGEADAAELTRAAVALLESDVTPELAGNLRFKTLMAVSALKMAERERQLAGAIQKAEDDIILASKLTSLAEVKRALRSSDVALSHGLHRALHTDAVLRTAVTRPAVLTDDEKKTACLLEKE
jgi:hypothetical protein